jgi:hypothetical protein
VFYSLALMHTPPHKNTHFMFSFDTLIESTASSTSGSILVLCDPPWVRAYAIPYRSQRLHLTHPPLPKRSLYLRVPV